MKSRSPKQRTSRVNPYAWARVHGVLLTRAGKEALLAGYEKRMLQHTKGALPGFSGSLRRHLYRQAERVAAFVHNTDASWTGVSWR